MRTANVAVVTGLHSSERTQIRYSEKSELQSVRRSTIWFISDVDFVSCRFMKKDPGWCVLEI
jgi:hypothetical protein